MAEDGAKSIDMKELGAAFIDGFKEGVRKNIDCFRCARMTYCEEWESGESTLDASYHYHPKFNADCPGVLEDQYMKYCDVIEELKDLERVLQPANDNPETVDSCNRKKCAVAKAINILQKVDQIKGYFNE